MQDLRVAAVQMQHAPSDKGANLAKIRLLAEQAAAQNAQIVAFPECCITGYWHLRKLSRAELTKLAEPVVDGPSSKFLLKLAADNGISIGAGLIEVDSVGKLYNTYIVAMPDGRLGWHRKLHAFVSPHLSSGERFTVFDTPQGVRVGVLICYDNNMIENVRATALLGAEVLLAPHQTGGCKSGSPLAMGLIDRKLWDERETNPNALQAELRGEKGRGWLLRWLPARAHDNGLFLVFANGIGPDDDEIRTGNAMVLDCYGRIIRETSKAGDDIVIADLDGSLRERSTGCRWLKARRPELYGLLAQPTGREQATRRVRFEYDAEIETEETSG